MYGRYLQIYMRDKIIFHELKRKREKILRFLADQ